jgi:hypothetical protein
MAGIHGQFGVFMFNSVTIPGVREVSDIGVNDAPMADTTAMGDTAQSAVKGIPGGGSFTISGVVAAGTSDHGSLGTRVNASTSHAFEWRPEGTGAGKGRITGTAFCTKFAEGAGFGDAVEFTAEFAVTGPVVFGVQP